MKFAAMFVGPWAVSCVSISGSDKSTAITSFRSRTSSFLDKIMGQPEHEDEDPHAGKLHFGDTRCPCIGFDNVDGTVMVSIELEKGDKKVAAQYPKDLGSRCEAWDNKRHPECGPGSTKEFCKSPWCYVDSCNCHIDVLPQMSGYLPEARYAGRPLFYSHATCGSKQDFMVKNPEFGSPGCQCVGFHGARGTIDVKVSKGQVAKYPASIGGTCKAWDKDEHPLCTGLEGEPKWCKQRWCYVDACACELAGGHVPKISKYLPQATFTGKAFYYSYETCNSEDEFTKKFHPNACVNQATEKECNNNHRCAWTGDQCLGAELVNHPLCEDLVESVKLDAKLAKELVEKSGVAVKTAVSTAVVALAATAMFGTT